MHDTGLTLTIISLCGILCLGAFWARRQALRRLAEYLPGLPAQVRIYIGLPLTLPSTWAEVLREEDGFLITAAGGRYPLSSVRAFMVTRLTGVVIDAAHPFLPWPTSAKICDIATETGPGADR